MIQLMTKKLQSKVQKYFQYFVERVFFIEILVITLQRELKSDNAK